MPLMNKLTLLQSLDETNSSLFIYHKHRRIIWLSSIDNSLGFAADFASISMHAVATDPDSVDKPCLYVQLELEEPEIILDGSDDDDEDAEVPVFPELRLIPTDPATLDDIFESFCRGAERNPDVDAEEEAQGSLFYDQSEVLAGALEAAEIEEDVDELVGDDPDRFIDADDQDGENEGNLLKSANGTT